MKRQEKQRAKADRRAQKKLADRVAADAGEVSADPDELRVLTAPIRNADFEQ
jgi:hypothetical protein